MEPLLYFALKSSGLLTAFFLAYWLLLRRETFFNANRWFLLAGLISSVCLPLIAWKKIVYVEPAVHTVNTSVVSEADWASAAPAEPLPPAIAPVDWLSVGLVIYLLISLVLLFRLASEFWQLNRLLRHRKPETASGLDFYDIPQPISPFSYFKSIVFNSAQHSREELQNILTHERVHSSQFHSVDVLISRIHCILFWWNPVSWLYHKAIVQNLEFIADSQAMSQLQDKRAYQYSLLRITAPKNGVSIINHFHQSLIKKRIIMLNKSESNKWNSLKYALIVPLVAVFLLSFQVKTVFLEKPLEHLVKAVTTPEEFQIRIDKNTSDARLKELSSEAKANGVKLKFSKVKRNAQGEITAIKAEFKDKYGKSGITHVESTSPIQPFFLKQDNQGLTTFSTDSNRTRIAIGRAATAEEVEEIALQELPEAPEPPEVPEAPEAPEAPEVPEIALIPSQEHKMIIITTKDGKTERFVADENGLLSFDTQEIIAQIDQDDIESISVVTDIFENDVRVNARRADLNELKKASKRTSEAVKKAMIKAKAEIKMAQARMKRDLQENKRSDLKQMREEQAQAMEEARRELAEARKEIEQARAEIAKARAEMEKDKKRK